jgi:hypothetical protein
MTTFNLVGDSCCFRSRYLFTVRKKIIASLKSTSRGHLYPNTLTSMLLFLYMIQKLYKKVLQLCLYVTIILQELEYDKFRDENGVRYLQDTREHTAAVLFSKKL